MTGKQADLYSVDTCNQLKEKFYQQKLFRPLRVDRYDAGTKLTYTVTGISQTNKAKLQLEVVKFVGGGFAGQVYKVKVLNIENIDGEIKGIKKDQLYAIKIMIPPSGFSVFFRNLVYRIGFQAPFQLQVNPIASRAGAIWQKFIRRGAKIKFKDEMAVNDIHATFVDSTLGSCGEISDWVDGRTWRLEVDEWMDILKKFKRGKINHHEKLGSPEYRGKKKFMADFVQLLYDMGAYEFARQYEWSTCKSQPNCLKRTGLKDKSKQILTAIDFRAGLALLPFLPMSPGDFLLIFKGLFRGSLVQFDRGDLRKLEQYITVHPEEFSDMLPLLEELKACEAYYRNSIPDITHNHIRLLYSRKLWSTILKSLRQGWLVRNIISPVKEKRFSKSVFKTFIFSFLGMIPVLGSFIRKLWAMPDWRNHYTNLLSNRKYLKRAIRAKCAEKAITLNRAERINSEKAIKISNSFFAYLFHRVLSLLPAGLHRFVSDAGYFKERLFYLFIRPIKLYFSGTMREQWLKDMLEHGRDKQMLTKGDLNTIHSQIKEPYIQKYLQSLAVHICTLPVTQIVSIIVSWIYVKTHPELTGPEAMAAVTAILVLFQITPISPGSLARGFYVVYLMIKDRSFKDYNIAVFLGFFKYVGYLAFPIQMTYRYPEMARFMAGHWATEAVHIIPVFGERGALLEHWIFGLFYNWPLTLRRRMRTRSKMRRSLPSRYWHVILYAMGVISLMNLSDFLFLKYTTIAPGIKQNWWIALIIASLCGIGITIGCGGASLGKRLLSTALGGMFIGAIYPLTATILVHQSTIIFEKLFYNSAWYIFLFALTSTVAAIITELSLSDPTISKP